MFERRKELLILVLNIGDCKIPSEIFEAIWSFVGIRPRVESTIQFQWNISYSNVDREALNFQHFMRRTPEIYTRGYRAAAVGLMESIS